MEIKNLVVTLLLTVSSIFINAQTCTPGDLVIAAGPAIIWDNTTKPANYTIAQNVCIESGATLNITNINVLFDGNYRITVHKGGALNLTNTTLKPAPTKSYWYGVVVMGDNDQALCDEINKTLKTANHGVLDAKNSTFEKPIYGILLTAYSAASDGGGIIKVNNCTFLNPYSVGILAGTYNVSGSNCRVNGISNCKFLLNDNNYDPEAFIKFNSYRNFTILGCEFEISSTIKKSTIGVFAKELINMLKVGGIVLEASEYVDPYNWQTSAKHPSPKKNIFKNLERGIVFEGSDLISSFESTVKNCYFETVHLGIEITKGMHVNVLCNEFNGKLYDNNLAYEISFFERIEQTPGSPTIPSTPTQTNPKPKSMFAYCEEVVGNINFLNNSCSWTTEFSDKEAMGVAFKLMPSQEQPRAYLFSGNTFTYPNNEGNKVTGVLYHGDFTQDPQLIGNEFSKLNKDIHVKGQLMEYGNSCFNVMLSIQGERLSDPILGTTTTVGNGNKFSDPSGHPQGNIFSDASEKFYVRPIATPPPNYDPYQRTSCAAVYTAAQNVNATAPFVDCTVPPVSGLLSNDRDIFKKYFMPDQCLQIFPNPVTDFVTIKLPPTAKNIKNSQIIVYNSLMVPIHIQTIERGETLFVVNCISMAAGLYYIALQNGTETICINKLIKQ